MDESGDESEPLFSDLESKHFHKQGGKLTQNGYRDRALRHNGYVIGCDTSESDCDQIKINEIPTVVCTCNHGEANEIPPADGATLEEDRRRRQEPPRVRISCLCDSQHSSFNFLCDRSSSLPQLHEENERYEDDSENAQDTKKTESENAESETPVSFSLWSTTRKEKLILISMASVELTSFMCLSIMAPFFPNEVG